MTPVGRLAMLSWDQFPESDTVVHTQNHMKTGRIHTLTQITINDSIQPTSTKSPVDFLSQREFWLKNTRFVT